MAEQQNSGARLWVEFDELKRRMVRAVKDLLYDLTADDVNVHRSTIQHPLLKEKLYGSYLKIYA